MPDPHCHLPDMHMSSLQKELSDTTTTWKKDIGLHSSLSTEVCGRVFGRDVRRGEGDDWWEGPVEATGKLELTEKETLIVRMALLTKEVQL